MKNLFIAYDATSKDGKHVKGNYFCRVKSVTIEELKKYIEEHIGGIKEGSKLIVTTINELSDELYFMLFPDDKK